MKEDKRLLVYYKEHHVGTLALTGDRKAAFEYTDEWIEKLTQAQNLPKKVIDFPEYEKSHVASLYLKVFEDIFED